MLLSNAQQTHIAEKKLPQTGYLIASQPSPDLLQTMEALLTEEKWGKT